MKTSVLEINTASSHYVSGISKALSFKKFINYIKKRISEETTIKKEYFEFVLAKLTADPKFLETIDLKNIGQFEEQLNLIYGVMLPPVADEKEVLWALSTPLDPKIFFGTSALYDLLTDKDTGQLSCKIIKEEEDPSVQKQKVQVIYALILKRLYNFDLQYKSEMIFSFIDEATNLPRFYNGMLDTSFVDIFPKEDLPELKFDNFQLKDNVDWNSLAEILPLSKLHFEGFSIIKLTDISGDHAVERIKNVILNHNRNDNGSYFQSISESLKTLIGNSDVDFGLLPVLRINSKVVFNHESYTYSMVMKNAMENGMNEEEFQKWQATIFRTQSLFCLMIFTLPILTIILRSSWSITG